MQGSIEMIPVQHMVFALPLPHNWLRDATALPHSPTALPPGKAAEGGRGSRAFSLSSRPKMMLVTFSFSFGCWESKAGETRQHPGKEGV